MPRGATCLATEHADMIKISKLLDSIAELPPRRLLHLLTETATLLEQHAERTWSARLAEAAAQVKKAQEAGEPGQAAPVLQKVLSYYGGMGSLSLLRSRLFLAVRQALSRSRWASARG
jgi:hypothetical protein